jgi:hypothetical protein
MVERHLSLPHTLACVTDTPEGLRDDIEIIVPPGDFVGIETPTWGGGLPNCFRRLAMFRPDAADIFGERFVCMDTDCVIADSLDPLFERDEDLIMYRGTNFSRPYNGSMMMLTAGCRPKVYNLFKPELASKAGYQYVGSDQSWISYVLGEGEAVWGHEDGVAWFGSRWNRDTRIMFFPGHPKPWHLVGRSKLVTDNYYGAEGGRCIILSVGKTLWQDALRAMAEPYDAVIALPEVADKWAGPLREVCNDETAALIAARMHGFDEVVVCGKMGDAECAFSA